MGKYHNSKETIERLQPKYNTFGLFSEEQLKYLYDGSVPRNLKQLMRKVHMHIDFLVAGYKDHLTEEEIMEIMREEFLIVP